MSALFRDQLTLLHEQGLEILDNQKTFPLPPDNIKCLSGPALLLVKSLPLTDASYNEAIHLLKENYGQPDEINRNLHISLRKLPTVHSNHGPEILCKELSTFVDEFEIIYLQMLEQEFDTNTLSIQMEIEGKLPPPILEEILKAKESGNWSTDKLRNTQIQDIPDSELLKDVLGA
uniref:Uncharacterized protein n=1 Tax=Meloidogyne floridensis TaxID=298350 RepID=A0A915NX92_9BILA